MKVWTKWDGGKDSAWFDEEAFLMAAVCIVTVVATIGVLVCMVLQEV